MNRSDTSAHRTGPVHSSSLGGEDLADADLVVLSHLRWHWVWQRPQHLISRFAGERRVGGSHVLFVEEPIATPLVTAPRLASEQHGDVERVWLEVPGEFEYLPFSGPVMQIYGDLLDERLGGRTRDVWLYSPMALDVAEALHPRLLVYDVMDALDSFALAPEGLVLRQRRALEEADLVLTGGRSLHRGVQAHRTEHTHLFPSGVEADHWRRARELRTPHDVPVVGYLGVVDERLDLELLADLAATLPDWDVQIVGPVTKIDAADLPQRANLHYLGKRQYDQLPDVLAGFDVALMPFALNEATRSISPTKTLEYLAAGLPVVSTHVPDVVADHGSVVHLVETGAEAADACRQVLEHSRQRRDAAAAPLQARQEWNAIADSMSGLLRDRLAVRSGRAARATA